MVRPLTPNMVHPITSVLIKWQLRLLGFGAPSQGFGNGTAVAKGANGLANGNSKSTPAPAAAASLFPR